MANVTYFSPDGGVTRYPIEDTVARGVWTSPVTCLTGDTSKTITNLAIHTTSFIKPFGQYDGASNYAGMPVPYKKITVSEGSAVVDFGQALPAAASIVLQIIN